MKLKEEVEKIINKFDLSLNLPEGISPFSLDPTEYNKYNLTIDSYNLFEKFKYNIPYGWYGFDIGIAPKSWYTAIEEILDLLIKEDKDFKIYQIKMKYGGIRFYVGSYIIDDLAKIESLIEKIMYDERLIY